jgi:predicted dehydrogenase
MSHRAGARRGAIVGFGFIAEKGHLPAYRARGDFEIVAVADVTAARREAAQRAIPGVRVYEDHETMLAKEGGELDFVDVSVPPYAHAPVARAALARGLHVLCEKPLAMRGDDARAMIDAAVKSHRVLFPAHNYKHAPVIRAVKKALDDDAIGEVHEVTLHTYRATHARGVAEWNESWRREKRYSGGGIAMDHGSHTFYLAFDWLRAFPTSITAKMSTRPGKGLEVRHDTEDTFSATMTFPTGVASAHLTWNAGVRRVIYTLHGSRGAIRVEDDDVQINVMDEPDRPAKTKWSTRRESISSSWMDASHVGWFTSMLGDFVTAIERRDFAGRNAEEALRCVELIEAAYASAADGSRELQLRRS